MYKKLLIYPILLLITLAIFLGYGFIFGGEFPIWLTAPFIFLNVLVLCVINFRGSKEKPLNKLMMYFILNLQCKCNRIKKGVTQRENPV